MKRNHVWVVELMNKHKTWEMLPTPLTRCFYEKGMATDYMRALPGYNNFPKRYRLRKYLAEGSNT